VTNPRTPWAKDKDLPEPHPGMVSPLRVGGLPQVSREFCEEKRIAEHAEFVPGRKAQHLSRETTRPGCSVLRGLGPNPQIACTKNKNLLD